VDKHSRFVLLETVIYSQPNLAACKIEYIASKVTHSDEEKYLTTNSTQEVSCSKHSMIGRSNICIPGISECENKVMAQWKSSTFLCL